MFLERSGTGKLSQISNFRKRHVSDVRHTSAARSCVPKVIIIREIINHTFLLLAVFLFSYEQRICMNSDRGGIDALTSFPTSLQENRRS